MVKVDAQGQDTKLWVSNVISPGPTLRTTPDEAAGDTHTELVQLPPDSRDGFRESRSKRLEDAVCGEGNREEVALTPYRSFAWVIACDLYSLASYPFLYARHSVQRLAGVDS